MIAKCRLAFSVSTLALAAATSFSTGADALKPAHGGTGRVGPLVPAYTHADPGVSGTWTPVTNTFPGASPDTSVLMTDGTVLMHDSCTTNWYRLTPDNTGNYVSGTWNSVAPMPAGYAPLYFATQVLPDADSRVIVNGGEYINCAGAESTLGALYDPIKNTWTSVTAPSGWSSIGDAGSAVLPNRQYMLANCCSTQEALATISGTTVSWTATGSGKADANSEEGWTNLPGGNLLTVDTGLGVVGGGNPVELYAPSSGTWTGAGHTFSPLVDRSTFEIGPAVLRPEGNIFYSGATQHTNLYDTTTGVWTAGPDFPVISGGQYDVEDGPAALLPDGNVLVQASPGVFKTPSHFFEYNGRKNKLRRVNEPATAPFASSYDGRMLELPTGQILWMNDNQNGAPDVEIYSPKGSPKAKWLPVISSAPSTLVRGTADYAISGKKFNGFSQGASYGDDAQMSSNYPLVRITNNGTGHVCFGRSHNFSTMGVYTTGKTHAKFDMPSGCDAGASSLQVIVNGIASAPFAVTVS